MPSRRHPAKPDAVDVADGVAVAEIGKQILADFGKVDILLASKLPACTRQSAARDGATRNGNICRRQHSTGAFNTVKAFQRSILKQKGARIIDVACRCIGLAPSATQARPTHAASEAGLIGFTKSPALPVRRPRRHLPTSSPPASSPPT